MDVDLLRNSPVGQLIPIEGSDARGKPFSHFAFLPDNLPDTLQLQPKTWTAVAAATGALGRLQQACAPLPNPRLLIAPALAREAVDTSALEGTYGALADVLEARLSESRQTSPEVAEIRAYERAANIGFDSVKDRAISVALLSDLQGILAEKSQEKQRDPGKVREHQVVIGPKHGSIYDARYIPPPPGDQLRAGLDHWQAWMREDHPMPPVLQAALAHYQFETLHPFGDGNGRIGRLVIVLQLLRTEALSEPAITVSPWFRRKREAYQDHLLHVSRTGEWDQWVTFFCDAICAQADAAVNVIGELTNWLATVRAELNTRHWSGTVLNICEALIDWPVINARFVQDTHEVSAPTAKSAIDRLVELDVLVEMTGKSYGRVYGAAAVMSIVEGM